jgi:hypothetical protein
VLNASLNKLGWCRSCCGGSGAGDERDCRMIALTRKLALIDGSQVRGYGGGVVDGSV